ncbi:MAG: QueT transporter family protein [Lachnospiraceae bacterium]|nr:QueT transporter family protein [Lachnospiraceae bacterium]
MQKKKVLSITQAAVIAAIYVILTYIANLFGLANYAIQVRFSEALTILPIFTPAAIPGLFIGCIISNILTGCMLLDVIFGSLATLIGAVGSYLIGEKLRHSGASEFLCSLPPIISNTLIVPFVLAYVYRFEGSILYFMLTVCIGEIISCFVLGQILLKALKPVSKQIFGAPKDQAAEPESGCLNTSDQQSKN